MYCSAVSNLARRQLLENIMHTAYRFLGLFLSALALTLTQSGCGISTPPQVDVTAAKSEHPVPAVVMAEWQERKLIFLSGPRANTVRSLRADRGAYVILHDLALPVGTIVTGMNIDRDRHELDVMTAQGRLTLPITPAGQLVLHGATRYAKTDAFQ
jgi:hypothetical protein